MASICVTPSARAASRTCPKTSCSGIGAPDLDLVEARGTRAVPRPHHLLRLAFAAVRHSPQGPVIAAGDGRAGIPEFGRNPAVAGVLEHPAALAMLDLPGDLAAELEVVPLVVDRPAAVGLHVNAV